jgi:hypothetical protein
LAETTAASAFTAASGVGAPIDSEGNGAELRRTVFGQVVTAPTAKVRATSTERPAPAATSAA